MASDTISGPPAGPTTTTVASARPKQDLWKAVGWTVVSVLAFTATAISGRECGKHMSPMHMVFFRNFLSLIILLLAFRWLGISFDSLRSRQPWLQWGRAMVHIAGQWCWMSALLLIPLIELMALEFTAPLWVALLAPLLLGEKLTAMRAGAAVIGFFGVLIMIFGPVVLSGGTVGPSYSLGTILALLCAVLFAFNMIGTRYLTRRDGPLTILMFMTVNHTVLAFALSFWTMKMPQGMVIVWVLVLGVSSLIAHFALARALAYGDAALVAPMDFLRIPIMVALGVAMYHEPLQAVAVLGTIIVLAGNAANIWSEHRRKQTAA